VAPPPQRVRPPVDRRAGRAATAPRGPYRPARTPPARTAERSGHPNERSVPERKPPPLWDRGLTLLIIFTASALLIVALVALAAAVGRWWILIPVMTADLAVTTAVLVTVVRLLNNGDPR
jgi:hypothetical protein